MVIKKKIIVVTHNGTFHADDVFACATLSIWADKNNLNLKIVRSRDKEIVEKGDIVLDVGMEYDQEKKRFDHHQSEGAGVRENKIPYASFGLIWKHYGREICIDEVWQIIEEKIAVPIDAMDNGVNISLVNELGVVNYIVKNALSSFNPTWQEGQKEVLKRFFEAVNVAKSILNREIAWAESKVEGTRLAKEAIKNQNEPEILVLDKYFECEEEVTRHSNIKFVAAPSDTSDNWSIIVARDDLEDYKSNRVTFPEAWRGLRDLALAEASGVPDAIFCHRGGWFAKAKSRAGVLEMAQKVLLTR